MLGETTTKDKGSKSGEEGKTRDKEIFHLFKKAIFPTFESKQAPNDY